MLTLLIGKQVLAQDSLKTDKKVSILPLPVIFSTPETGLGFGALTSGVFNLGNRSNTRTSNVQILGAYTVNNQIITRINNNIFTKGEQYNLFGEISYFDFPILYYGIGNNTEEENEEELGYQIVNFQQRLLKQFKKGDFLGVQYRFSRVFDVDYSPINLTDSISVRGGAGTVSGFGPAYVHDTRDNVLNSSEGNFLELSATFHAGFLGSDFNFTRYRIDYRRFWKLNDQSVLATQFLGEFNNGDVPWNELAQMGGDQIMRGYYQGRYRDKNQVALQGEYRRQLIPWIGVVAFAAVGEVGNSIDDISISNFKWTAGGGLRIMVNKRERTNVRIDYGIGNGPNGLYFGFAEAF